MKKTILLATLLIAGIASAFAQTVTAKAFIKYNGTTLKVREIAEMSDAYDNGYDVANYNTTGIYVCNTISGKGSNWIQWASNDIEGVKIAFKADAAGEQTFTFSNVEGTLYLIDAVANKSILITEGGSYAFTAEANQTIADRFSIAKNIPAKFINNQLVINDAAVGAEVNVTPFSFVEGRRVDGTKVTYNAPVNQALNGNYFEVEYTNKNGVARKFIVNANPVLD